MRELEEARAQHRKREDLTRGRRGLLIVNTGKGKGKTTKDKEIFLARGEGIDPKTIV